MPLPSPKGNETRDEFMNRCMADRMANSEFPDNGQRYAVCEARYTNSIIKSDEPRTLYISRPVLNAEDIVDWAIEQGLEKMIAPEDLHVTVAYSNRPIDWMTLPRASSQVVIPEGGPRMVTTLGDDNVVVLRFNSPELNSRWAEILDHGASWDYDAYRPHITITPDSSIDLDSIQPFAGRIVLGPERFDRIRTGGYTQTAKYDVVANVEKVSGDKQVVYGWFSVIEEGGRPVIDHHGDYISEETLVQAAHQYVTESRAGKVMHQGVRVGDLVESVVFTPELQRALGIDLGKVGWFGAMHIRDSKVWADIKSGKLPAFSIGGFSRQRVPL